MYRIGEFSRMGKATIKALRHYDAMGLLKPETVDQFTGYRFYTTRQLVELHRIQSLRQIGLSLNEIGQILAGRDEKELLEQRRKELETEIARSQQQLSRIEFILSGKEEALYMNYQATIKEIPACIVYSKQVTVPNFDGYYTILPAIRAEAEAANPGLKYAAPPYCFIMDLDEEYREQDIHVEYCAAVERMGKDAGKIQFKRMDAVTVVSVMSQGPFSGIAQAYAFAFKWMDENGYVVGGRPRENYIDGRWNGTPEEKWLVELQIPIARK